MSTVRHVWALDGDVQSCHRMPTIMVDEECAGFPAAVTDVVALTPFLTPPMDLSRFFLETSGEWSSNNRLAQTSGASETNPGRMLTQGWKLVSCDCWTVVDTTNLQTLVWWTFAIWGTYCDVTVDPCAACRGIATMLARKARLPMWQWEDRGRFA